MTDPLTQSGIARYLVEAARIAPSADNSQPFQFVWNGAELAISYSPERGGKGIFDATAHATLMSLGGVIESIEQAAAAAGLELQWQALDLSGGALIKVSFVVSPMIDALPEDSPLFGRHTNRFPFARTPVPSDVLQHLGSICEGGARISIVASSDTCKDFVGCIRIAAEARFCNEDLHHWLMGSLRFDAEAVSNGDGLDIATLHMPPGGALFMKFIADWSRMAFLNRFGLYKLLALTETQLLSAAPAIVCVVGKTGYEETVQAGRLLARVWIDLNRRGIAVHPYYVISDQLLRLESNAIPTNMISRVAGIKRKLPGLLGLAPGEFIHMILRIGFPKGPVPRSKRLPLERVFSDIS